MFDPSSFLFSSPSVDLYDDFPPLSRAGLPDGMMVEEKKARRPARKRGDSVHLKGRCLAEAEEAGSDQETQEAKRDGGQSEAEDRAVFQFFSDEVHQRRKERRRKVIFLSFLHLFYIYSEIRVHRRGAKRQREAAQGRSEQAASGGPQQPGGPHLALQEEAPQKRPPA